MQTREPMRRMIAALLIGVLVGGGLMVVTPAGAKVAEAAATNWKKIWKKKLQPLADKRYYTKAKSEGRYQPKGSYAPAGSSYTKAESDGKYAAAGSSYSKAESDGKYAGAGTSYSKAEGDGRYVPKRSVLTGPWAMAAAPAGGQPLISLNFPAVASVAPTDAFYIAPGAVPPVQCPGTDEAPNAQPGYLCVFGSQNANINGHYFFNLRPDGAVMAAFSTNDNSYSWGNWAFRPTGYAAPGMAVKSPVTPLTGSAAGQ